MVGITLSAQLINSAPPEVRRWIEAQVRTSLGLAAEPPAPPESDTTAKLDVCSIEEAAKILRLITDDYLCAQIFFELGRDIGHIVPSHPDLYAISIADIARHTQIADRRRVLLCLTRIEAAFQTARGNAESALLSADAAGNCYLRATTHAQIRDLWLAISGANGKGWSVSEPTGEPTAAPPYRSV